MSRTAIIAFSGKFFFQMPEYNNAPKSPEVQFDPSWSLNQVKLVAGSDPADYFRFNFRDCTISSITWSDGKSDPSDSVVVGRPVDLTGFMVDVSPSAICAVVYAGRLNVGGLAEGKMAAAFQSDLRLTVRSQGFGDLTAAAHYQSDVILQKVNESNTAAIDNLLTGQPLEIVFQVNRYTDAVDAAGQVQSNGLVGDIYGVIRRKKIGTAAGDGARLRNRRLVAHPDIGKAPDVEKIFLTDTGTTPLVRITDIDGYYDLDIDARFLMLRPLDFIPYLDFNYATPTSAGVISKYIVYIQNVDQKRDIGTFVGTHEEMLATGGVISFNLSNYPDDLARLSIGVDVVTNDGRRCPLMVETEWDIELVDSPRGLKLPSTAVHRLRFRVFQNNIPSNGVQAATRAGNDGRSPTVADIRPVKDGVSDSEGTVEFDVLAKNLSSLGNIPDPVTNTPVNQAPLDRQYGSTVYVSIPNPLRRAASKIEEIQICVRVLPVFDEKAIKGLCSFKRDVAPMLGYYTRFFPWLHTRHSGSGYRRFFNLENLESVASHVDEMLRRIALPDDAEDKMPRSRDLPLGVAEIIRKWRDDGWQP